MSNFCPQSLVMRNLKRACELHALHTISNGTTDEMNEFVQHLHSSLDIAIDETMQAMENRIRIQESIRNPKISEPK